MLKDIYLRGLSNLRLFKIFNINDNSDYICLFAYPLIFDNYSNLSKDQEDHCGLKYMYFFRSFHGITKGFYIDISITTKSPDETASYLKQFQINNIFTLPRDNKQDFYFNKIFEIAFQPLICVMEWDESEYLQEIYKCIYMYLNELKEEKIKNLYINLKSEWNSITKFE